MSVVLFVKTEDLTQALSKIDSFISTIQSIYNGLTELGAESVSLDDIKGLVDTPFIRDIKVFVFGGNTVTVGGLQINVDAIEIDMSIAQNVIAKLKSLQGKEIDFDHYEVDEDEIVRGEDVEADITPLHTVYGSELAAEVIEDVEELCDQLNAIYAKILAPTGAGLAYHPLRNPQRLFSINVSNPSPFTVNKESIAYYMKPY